MKLRNCKTKLLFKKLTDLFYNQFYADRTSFQCFVCKSSSGSVTAKVELEKLCFAGCDFGKVEKIFRFGGKGNKRQEIFDLKSYLASLDQELTIAVELSILGVIDD
jgi:hypothetical protein